MTQKAEYLATFFKELKRSVLFRKGTEIFEPSTSLQFTDLTLFCMKKRDMISERKIDREHMSSRFYVIVFIIGNKMVIIFVGYIGT